MEELHCPNNIKVHYAGAEQLNFISAAHQMGISYSLYTAYPSVSKIVFSKNREIDITVPQYLSKAQKHVIQDSGLFTLMFGSQKGKKDEHLMNRWYDGLVEFTNTHKNGATCVEVDCQKVLGVQKAWEFRKRIQKDLPNNRIINVFHLEDGIKGLDELIEFSNYIAISVPEMRFAGKKNWVYNIAKYIKQKKPSIDIHLLGCTELKLLHQCKFCTSADSTSWLSGVRYGFIKGNHIKNINKEKLYEVIGDDFRNKNIHKHKEGILLNIALLKQQYEEAAGPQDYYSIKRILEQ